MTPLRRAAHIALKWLPVAAGNRIATALAITEPHPPDRCGSHLHCYSHSVDEPLRGYRWCLECAHMFVTEAELLAAHNQVLAEIGMPPETDVSGISCCPHCVHDW